MSEDLFDMVINEAETERPAFRQAPEQDYLVITRSAKKVKANSGTTGIEINFTLLEGLGNADMEGVDLARCRLRDTVWVTENTASFVGDKLARINPEVRGQSLRESMDLLPGNEVVVKVVHETANRDGTPLNIPRLVVKGYYSKEWYMNNKLAA